MSKTILLVTTGSPMKKYVLEHIKSLGYQLVVLESAPNWASPLVDDWILADLDNFEACLKAVKKFSKPMAAIVTFDEFAVELCGFLNTELGLKGISYNVAKICRNKHDFRTFCQANQLPVTPFRLIKSAADVQYVQNHFSTDIVIKPTKAAGSQEVQALSTSQLNLKQHQGYLVEQTLQGREVDIDALVQDGAVKFYSISDNFNTGWPYFLQDKAYMPSNLASSQQDTLFGLLQTLIKKLNIKDGCLHLEAMIDGSQVCPLELNLRMGASATFTLNKAVYGVDLIDNILKIHQGQTLEDLNGLPVLKQVRTQYFRASNAGKLNTLQINSHTPGYEELNFYCQIGDLVALPPADFRALGHIVVSGKDRPEAEANLAQALQQISYTVAPH